jgi:hypothetical protein
MIQRRSSSRIKRLAVFLLLTSVGVVALAEDALVNGGRSPDGRYEVRISHNRGSDPAGIPDSYSLHLRRTKAKKPLSPLNTVGGYLYYAGARERCQALWHSSGEFVAVTDQETKHSKEIYIFAVSGGRASRLDFPDYIQNVLGRVDATEVASHCISNPKAWDGDDLLLEFYFSTKRREGGRVFYSVDVTLHLFHGPNNAPVVGLKSVGVSKELEG